MNQQDGYTILESNELEAYIANEYVSKIEKYLNKALQFNIKFENGGQGSNEGTYAFSLNGVYSFIVVEKGSITKEKTTTQLNDIVYWFLEGLIFDLALDYAMKNKQPDKDFRRVLFQKELEIWQHISGEFYCRKKSEIDNILEKNPFTD